MPIEILGLAAFFMAISFFVAGVLFLLFEKRIMRNRRISSLVKMKIQRKRNKDKAQTLSQVRQWEKTVAVMEQKMSEKNFRILEAKLREAGYPLNLTPASFTLLQLSLGFGLPLIIFLLLLPGNLSLMLVILIAVGFGIYGASYPVLLLKSKKNSRIKIAFRSMPDFFDVICLSIEAGMGLDAALHKVCQHTSGPLSDEFKITLEDMKMGLSRREAFTELKNRVPLELFQSVISSLIQADRLGIGMSKVIRSQTERIRYEQLQQVREQALKIPVKILIPMVLFIFPVIFLIIIGPLVVQFVTGGLS